MRERKTRWPLPSRYASFLVLIALRHGHSVRFLCDASQAASLQSDPYGAQPRNAYHGTLGCAPAPPLNSSLNVIRHVPEGRMEPLPLPPPPPPPPTCNATSLALLASSDSANRWT